jgi:RNA polymerase sigma factor (sigma-70 family)
MDVSRPGGLHHRPTDGLGGFRGEATFRNWLFRIAANVCLDHLRRRKREPAVALEDLDWEPADTAYAERADSRELAAYVEKILDRLKAKDRLVLTLLDLEGHVRRGGRRPDRVEPGQCPGSSLPRQEQAAEVGGGRPWMVG